MTVKKANPDYSSSAVNLYVVLPDVEKALEELRAIQDHMEEVEIEIDRHIPPDLREARSKLEITLHEQEQMLKSLIDHKGSWQDVEKGRYAVKQLKQSWTYNPEPFMTAPPDSLYGRVCPMVTGVLVDVKTLTELIKGNILNEDDLKKEGVIVPGKTTFAYVIKTGEKYAAEAEKEK